MCDLIYSKYPTPSLETFFSWCLSTEPVAGVPLLCSRANHPVNQSKHSIDSWTPVPMTGSYRYSCSGGRTERFDAAGKINRAAASTSHTEPRRTKPLVQFAGMVCISIALPL